MHKNKKLTCLNISLIQNKKDVRSLYVTPLCKQRYNIEYIISID